jgi:hypothetical protein
MVPGQPGSDRGRTIIDLAAQHVVIDQLLVDRALPAAVKAATGALVSEKGEFQLPKFLTSAVGGCPVFDPATVGLDFPPVPLETVAITGAPAGAFLIRLSHPTLERMGKGEYAKDAWVVFAPTSETDFANGDQIPRLLVSNVGAFNATKERWTFGRPNLRDGKVHILYFSHVAPRSEITQPEQVKVVGRAHGVFVEGQLQLLGGV